MRFWKQSALCLSVLILLCLTSPSAFGGDEKAFTGEIGDTQCAMNVHSLDKSHKEMLKVKSVGKTAADCTLYCIKIAAAGLCSKTRTKFTAWIDRNSPNPMPDKKYEYSAHSTPKQRRSRFVELIRSGSRMFRPQV